jgi:hypothetical protein
MSAVLDAQIERAVWRTSMQEHGQAADESGPLIPKKLKS